MILALTDREEELWWIAVILGFVVIVAVVALLTLLVMFVKTIEDRVTTIKLLADDASRPDDFVRPGHINPLRARDGGSLVRTGQTEGSVDLARLAGCRPAGIVCEIMNDDGTMSRLPELIEFARRFEMPILTVADLIAYRLREEPQITQVARGRVTTDAMGPTAKTLIMAPLVSVPSHVFRR